jgi:hypothetical protein
LEWTYILLGSGLFVLAIGIRNGEFNLFFYLLRGIHHADSSALRNDWYTEVTRSYHVVWNHVVEFSVRHDVLTIMLTLGALACGSALCAALYLIAKALYDRPLLPWAAAVVLLAGTYTRSIGDFYLLPPTLEPFGIAGAAIVCGLAALAWEKPAGAGLAFGIAAFWHLQLGALIGLVILAVTVSCYGRLGITGIGKLWVPYLALGLPGFYRAYTLTQAEGADEALRILSTVAPQNYTPWNHDPELLITIGAATALAVVGSRLRRPTWQPMFFTAVLAMLAVVLVSVAVGATGRVDSLVRALPWRLAPFVLAVGLLLGAAGVLQPSTEVTRRKALLTSAYVLMAILAAAGPTRMKVAVLAVVLVSLLVRIESASRRITSRSRVVLSYGTLAAVLAVMAIASTHHLGLPTPSKDRAAAYTFAASTPPGTVFAVPPDFVDFRLLTRRGIVVDWAAPPLYNLDVIEWAKRLRAISGSSTLPTTLAALNADYERPSCGRLRRLASSYEVSYFIFRSRTSLPCLEVVSDSMAFRISRLQNG